MGKPCRCTLLIKTHIFYCKSNKDFISTTSHVRVHFSNDTTSRENFYQIYVTHLRTRSDLYDKIIITTVPTCTMSLLPLLLMLHNVAIQTSNKLIHNIFCYNFVLW